MNETLNVDEKSLLLLERLREKLEPVGQNLGCHLEGLVHAGYLSYWDYTQLGVLLNIQQPRTGFADENIFIIYHQITELYFKLVLQEMEQLCGDGLPATDDFILRIKRINRYFENLVFSFNIMLDGFDREQFLLFRTALAPASGFQSMQYRLIELGATGMVNLVAPEKRAGLGGYEKCEALYRQLYWKGGATDAATGQKDLSLVNFEKKYDAVLLEKARNCQDTNLNQLWQRHAAGGKGDAELAKELRKLDNLVNIQWRLAHYRTAAKYLRSKDGALRATGGTNWREYLPPRFQRIIFFPSLWTDTEKADWGKAFIEDHFLNG